MSDAKVSEGYPDVKCPVCGSVRTDLWEVSGPFELENKPYEIDECECGARLELSARVMVTYILKEIVTR